ncbi:MAG: cobyric acid synthase [Chloroflexi bacterium]|nr:cobyric acid synthase [Chloroflexota bacterium]
MGRVLMVQGTMSHVGKSVLAAALCRILRQEGYRVAPFKAQNMSLNSYATPDGGEIGRAQAMQAEAAGVAPSVDMNPVLLKPEADQRSQVVVLGQPLRAASAREYHEMKEELWPVVTGALDRLRVQYDVVMVEGAGSPAEVNLKDAEIVNMRVARYTGAPVLLVGDIDRGGVFAQLVGTMALLEPVEQALVKGLVINKFRGDPGLLESGLELLVQRLGVPILGVLPMFTNIHLPEEDSLGLPETSRQDDARPLLDIAVIRLPHIANFDDVDPLRREPGVRVRYVSTLTELGTPDLIILPGTKTTVADMEWLRSRGLDAAIVVRRLGETPVIGICGGYQMLGWRVLDPEGVESPQSETPGLGLLPLDTVFQGDKAVHQIEARVIEARGLLEGCQDMVVKGYEIHMGRAVGGESSGAFQVTTRSQQAVEDTDGMLDAQGLTLGTYMHGLFHNPGLRRALLEGLAQRKGVALPPPLPGADPDTEYDKLADHVRRHLDMERLFAIAGLRPPKPPPNYFTH